MKLDWSEHMEDFWIEVVEGSVDEGEPVICVPVDAITEQTAIVLASKLQIEVTIQGNAYLFTATKPVQFDFDWNKQTLH